MRPLNILILGEERPHIPSVYKQTKINRKHRSFFSLACATTLDFDAIEKDVAVARIPKSDEDVRVATYAISRLEKSGTPIVAVGKSKPEGPLAELLSENRVQTIIGDYQLSLTLGKNDLLDVLRHAHFRLAAEQATRAPQKEVVLDMKSRQASLRMGEASVDIQPWHAAILTTLADGEIYGNDVLRQRCSKSNAKDRQIVAVETCTLNSRAREVGMPLLVQNCWRFGRRLNPEVKLTVLQPAG